MAHALPFGAMGRVFDQLGLRVLQRCWLSSNNVVFRRGPNSPATVIDTGYDTHSGQTVELVARTLEGEPLGRIVNTHLHSDHCGGNAALQLRWGCETWVPEMSLAAVSQWDASRLTFRETGQACQRFAANESLRPGDELWLGGHRWAVVPAPGHDAEALMFFQPESRVLISGDALWENRLAIVFSALSDSSGFAAAGSALAAIEALDPVIVIPGHGAPFSGVAEALSASRRRLQSFEADPRRHAQHAMRSLTMFRMLEVRCVRRQQLLEWLLVTPIFGRLSALNDGGLPDPERAAVTAVDGLIADGILASTHGDIHLPDQVRP